MGNRHLSLSNEHDSIHVTMHVMNGVLKRFLFENAFHCDEIALYWLLFVVFG